MKFVLAIMVFVVIGLILGVGILQVMQGEFLLLTLGTVGFIALFAKYGCKSH